MATPSDPVRSAVAGFDLDPFQVEAVAALDAGRSVLVAAPTGSGKTLVAEHAVDLALRVGGKAFYTTPIKALSNQKYHDLGRRLGSAQVGLLTGDNSVNGDAPVVVMTTEVLRNMLYARSPALDGLRFVVLDEVHFLQDAYRGPVWEEVMIHLPPDVRLVCLSATVSNADELAEWIETVRGPTTSVVETHRPVDLVNLYAVDDRATGELSLTPVLVDGAPNPRGRRFDVSEGGPPGARRRRWAPPHRNEVVDLLAARELLPAIWFIFSRAGCDDAVAAALRAGLRFTDAAERRAIDDIATRHTSGLTDDDLAVLGHDAWLAALLTGVAAHHAGMVPPFKEAVEECFVRGLVRVVFATETLALGINMPARTVIIDKLTKFTGDRHEFLRPSQYTQLTGRAGRRGIDEIGHAVVPWSPYVRFDEVAELAASRSFVLSSAFRPTYNMAANLVHRYDAAEAHHLLNLSFAQFQADRSVVRLERRLGRRQERLDELRRAARCDRGDVEEYRRLVDAERASARARRAAHAEAVHDELAALRPGEVVWLHGGKNAGPVVVLSVGQRRGGTLRVRALTGRRRLVTLDSADFDGPPERVGRVELPQPYAPTNATYQRKVADLLAAARLRRDEPPTRDDRAEAVPSSFEHPVAGCPDRDQHLRAARQVARTETEVRALEARIGGHSASLARTFDQVLRLLEAWGHLDGWQLTDRGELLARTFHECDLLVAEAVADGLLGGLAPAELAGVVSCFVYEHRSPNPAPTPWYPSTRVRDRVDHLLAIADDLNADEASARLPLTRRPDPTFLPLAHAWASGADLDVVLEDEDLAAGDFVRTAKLVVDLLGQLADAAPDRDLVATARAAAAQLHRGVVAVSSEVAALPDGGDDDRRSTRAAEAGT